MMANQVSLETLSINSVFINFTKAIPININTENIQRVQIIKINSSDILTILLFMGKDTGTFTFTYRL